MDYTIHNLSIIGDRQVGLALAPKAQEVLRELKDRMAITGMFSGALYRRLSDVSYCYVRVAGETNLISIVAGSLQEPVMIPQFQRAQPPEVLSGVVTYGFLSEEEDLLSSYYPTLTSQRLHQLPAGQQRSARLAVKPYQTINTSKLEHPSQYSGVRPTMYSGRMKRVVQAIMGLGRLPANPLYKDVLQPLADGELPEPLSDFEQEVLRDGYQVRYDFRWFRTHGVAVGADRRLWLVEIGGTRGMVAMPLPLNPLSLSEKYRLQAEKLGDSDVLAYLEEFDGVPTGEAFPDDTEDLEALIRAGQVLRLLTTEQLSGFYQLTGLSSACGWAFNESGTEAHNTGYGWYADGLQFCAHYNINIAIAASKMPNDGQQKNRMRQALRAYNSRFSKVRFEAALAKLDYMSTDELQQQFRLLSIDGPDLYLDRLDQLVVQPIAPGSMATMGKVGEGNMANAQTASVYNLKLWEPAWTEEMSILSHDFSANTKPWIRFAECDTTVFVFFAGDQLKTIKWFATNKDTATDETVSDYEDCMYIGKWSKTTTYGGRGVRRAWYSDDFDDRTEFADSSFYEEIEGTKLGIGGAAWNDWIFPQERGTLSRNVFFRRRTYRKSVGSQGQVTAVVCLPAYMREACFYAIRETQSGIAESETWSNLTLADPWSATYAYAMYEPASIGSCGPNYLTRYVMSVDYDTSSPCAEIADSGQWMRPCDLVAAPRVGNILIGGGISPYWPNPTYPPLPAGYSRDRDYEGTLNVRLVYFGGVIDMPEESGDTFEWVSQDLSWFLPSPEVSMPDGSTKGYLMHMWATANAFGASEAIVYQPEPDAPEEIKGADNMPYLKNQACFLGVVNG